MNMPRQTTTRRRFLQLAGVCTAACWTLPQAFAQDAFGQALLRGAGSTFILPLVRRWLALYRDGSGSTGFAAGNGGLEGDLHGGAALDYEAIGSQAGLQRLQAKAVDFALSELPLSSPVLSRQDLIQIPIVSGGVAIVAHLPGFKQTLRLDGPTLAAIYRGRITRWNDAALLALNPGVTLPDSGIDPIHRSEGSGSTYTLSRYLAGHDAHWQETIGTGATGQWPMGTAVRGSAGVAQALMARPGSVGYLDVVQAQATGLNLVQLKNSAGHFIAPSMAAIEAATQAVPWQASQQTQPQFIDAPGEASYPVVATVLAVLNRSSQSSADRRARAFLAWALANGQASARDLGYVALPSSLAQQVRGQLLGTVPGQDLR